MEAASFLRCMGDGLAGGMRDCEVPDLLVANWHQAWTLMVADAAEDDEDVHHVVLRTIQALRTAREMTAVYRRG